MKANDAIEIISRYSLTEIIIVLIAVVVIASLILSCLKKGYETLEAWRQKKNGVENKEKSIEERVQKLEESDREFNGKLDNISAGVQQLCATIDTVNENNRQIHIATMRSTLMRLWFEAKEQGYMTQSQFETYAAIADLYKGLGGNGLFRHKILPEMDAMEIRED